MASSKHPGVSVGTRLRALHAALTLTIIVSLGFATRSTQAQTLSVLYSFTGGTDGAGPQASLIQDSAGNFYGIAGGGIWRGQQAAGVVFRLNPSGGLTVLTTFRGVLGDGGDPIGPLARDSAGNLYGVTMNGGGPKSGTVFEITPDGGRLALHLFGKQNGDGKSPYAGLISDKKGNLYGTTAGGGASGLGTVFRLHLNPRKEAILYSFTGMSGDGLSPFAPLIRDAAGNLYGTTEAGGTYSGACGSPPFGGCGTVFKIDNAGKETVLYSFIGGTDGTNPFSGLVRDRAGNLYGTTYFGGSGACLNGTITGCGKVFKVDKSGKETVLHSFAGGSDGAQPYQGLVRDSAGNLYGTTSQGGKGNCQPLTGCGTVFKVTKNGKETILYRFTGGKDGAVPVASLLIDAAGNLYGTAAGGGIQNKKVCGNSGCGVVFKITP